MTFAVLCFVGATASRHAPLLHSPAAVGGGLAPLASRRRLATAAAAAPAPAPVPTPEPVRIFYAAVYLDEESQEDLLDKAPAVLDVISAGAARCPVLHGSIGRQAGGLRCGGGGGITPLVPLLFAWCRPHDY